MADSSFLDTWYARGARIAALEAERDALRALLREWLYEMCDCEKEVCVKCMQTKDRTRAALGEEPPA